MLIVLPAGATFLIFYKLFELLDNLILQHINAAFNSLGIPSSSLLDLLAFVAVITLVGFFGGNFLGRNFIRLANLFMIHMLLLSQRQHILKNEVQVSEIQFKKGMLSPVSRGHCVICIEYILLT